MQNHITQFLIVALVSVVAAFFPYLASHFFDSSQLHGLLSADTFLLLLLFLLPYGRILYKTPLIIAAGVYGIALECIDAYVIMGIVMLAVFISACMPRKKNYLLITYIVFSVFFIIADIGNFFYSTFVLTLPDVWDLAKFYWWGPIAFVAVPLFILLLELSFARKVLWGKNRLELSHSFFFVIIAVVLSLNLGVNKLQDRQPILNFAVKKWLWQICTPGIIGQNTYLQEDVKAEFPIWEKGKETILDDEAPTIVILVESYGVNKSISYTKALFSPFAGSNIKFSGLFAREVSHTQGAEWEDFRTLGGKISGTPLPQKFKDNGFQTWYMHGYEEKFYDRKENYGKFGFDSLLFKNDFLKRKLSNCRYGFEGICDSAIIAFIDSMITDSMPKFIYWTTLDAHPPYELANIGKKSPNCEKLSLSEVDCTYLTLQEGSLKQIAILASNHPNYRFVIRGDHRPMGSLDQSDFVQSFYFRWVPLIILNYF